MRDLKGLTRMALAAGVMALLAVGVAYLALTDIAHGGEDLSLEWRALRACGFVILLAQALGMAALWRWMRSTT
jgi:hypothetical protein